jgi:hypothetical protein
MRLNIFIGASSPDTAADSYVIIRILLKCIFSITWELKFSVPEISLNTHDYRQSIAQHTRTQDAQFAVTLVSVEQYTYVDVL